VEKYAEKVDNIVGKYESILPLFFVTKVPHSAGSMVAHGIRPETELIIFIGRLKCPALNPVRGYCELLPTQFIYDAIAKCGQYERKTVFQENNKLNKKKG
jgi:hypothetical protein